ncbi:MAG: hypothetical protein WB696_07110 [Chthoniobacterales bacterium]
MIAANTNPSFSLHPEQHSFAIQAEIYSVFRPKFPVRESNIPSGWYQFVGSEPRLPSASIAYHLALASEYEDLRERIRSYGALPQGWDSYRAGPILAVGINNAITAINRLQELSIKPLRIAPTSDGSVLIRYARDERKFEWEFFSDGDNLRAEIDEAGNETCLEVSAGDIVSLV